MAKFLLAHDLGTSGNKVTLFDVEGKLIKSVIAPYDTHYFNGSWAEQSTDDWWKAVCDSTKHLLSGIDKKQVVAVSFSGQMQNLLCIDKAGRPLGPSIIWADMRSSKEEKHMRTAMDPWKYYTIAGTQPSSGYTLEKLMWLKANDPDAYKNTYKILSAKDYIIYKMTGKIAIDPSNGSGTSAMDIVKRSWSEEIIDAAGVDGEMFPEILEATTVMGEIGPHIADECGLAPGTLVVLGGGDGQCASVGAGSIAEGRTYLSAGSSAWVATASSKPIYSQDMGVVNLAHVVPGMLCPSGTMQTAGSAFNWIKNELCRDEQRLAAEQGKSPYDFINAQIESAPVGSNGMLFLPYLMGERAPRWNPNAKGSFVGMKMNNTRADMLRSVIEGVAMNLCIILRQLQQHMSIDQVAIIGGLSKGSVVRQIIADVFGTDILQLSYMDEMASMGAAVIAGVGAGVLEGFEDISRFSKVTAVSKADPANTAKYAKLMGLFDKAYESMLELYDELSAWN
ncbi:MAG: FGGY-family carbohydrate kinase [Christensenellaceae bacterium]|nr:FGGY-family carbohydrate kinase [Christensenellaceae bacterium]